MKKIHTSGTGQVTNYYSKFLFISISETFAICKKAVKFLYMGKLNKQNNFSAQVFYEIHE
jgi:hypothetical protein